MHDHPLPTQTHLILSLTLSHYLIQQATGGRGEDNEYHVHNFTTTCPFIRFVCFTAQSVFCMAPSYPQAPPALNVRDFYGPGSAPFQWINRVSYPPKTTEMLLLNTMALGLATFLLESVKESPQGQVSILIVTILNRFQSLTPTILTMENKDDSTPASPTWAKTTTLTLAL